MIKRVFNQLYLEMIDQRFAFLKIIFTHLKLWIASIKWMKIPIKSTGPDYIRFFFFYQHITYQLLKISMTKRDINQQN